MSQLIKKHEFNEIYDGQAVFRLVLEAIANPSRVISIKSYSDKLFGDNRPMLALALTLLDNDVCFNTCENRELSEEIISLTLSRREKLSVADFLFVSNADGLPDIISEVKCGTLADPHKSATVIIQNNSDTTCGMVLSGPGIKVKCNISVSALVKTVLEIRDQQHFEYPQGIDFIFINASGDIFAIPRLIRWEVC